ncbi:MAG TPA: GNAT family N-acetyltransferase [Actinomycetota bacterium]|nr:GNAT family N-acetyltransferase [Actinomycetota bacterium]
MRRATAADGDAVVGAVGRLLAELRARPGERAPAGARAAFDRLATDPDAGAVVIAVDGDALTGVIAASYGWAVHAGGRVAVIQELWVAPDARGAGTGAALVEAVVAAARERGVTTVEVGLPRPSFAGSERTRAFYERCGFETVGPRMRRKVAGGAP